MNEDKRLIEDTFPVKEVSAESTHEKNIRRMDTFPLSISGGRDFLLLHHGQLLMRHLTRDIGKRYKRMEPESGTWL